MDEHLQVLSEMAESLGFDGDEDFVVIKKKMPQGRQGIALWSNCEQVGSLESRFGSAYDDESDGYSGYLYYRNGGNWTDVLPSSSDVLALLNQA